MSTDNFDLSNLDLSAVESFGNSNYVQEHGEHEMIVKAISLEQDEKDGQPRSFVLFTFSVKEGSQAGKITTERVYLPAAAGKLKQILETIGVPVDGTIDLRSAIARNRWLGAPIVIETAGGTNPKGNPITNNVQFLKSKYFKPLTAGAPGGGPPTGIPTGSTPPTGGSAPPVTMPGMPSL